MYFLAGCGLSIFVAIAGSNVKDAEHAPIQEFLKNRNGAVLLMGMAVFFAPLFEETLFRGYLYPVLARIASGVAQFFGIYDRGLLRPGMVADITVFDPDTVQPLPEDVVHDFPAGGWRIRELAQGIHYTIVNGQVLLEDGRHTGALPGRVLRNTL